jgi:tetratricopeptide (TPR) repeat protein
VLEPAVRALREGELPVIFRGLRGVGKTTLLAQAALELRDDLPQAFAMSFDGPAREEPAYAFEDINAFLTDVGRGIDLRRVRGRDRRATYDALLEQFFGFRALVLLDAVDLAAPELQTWLLAEFAALPTVCVAATIQSRTPDVAAHLVAVPPLTPDEAVEFVYAMARVQDVHVDPADLVGRLPRSLATHPQALATVVAHLRDLPIELLLLDRLPTETRSPATWVEQTLTSMDDGDLEVLSLVRLLGGTDLPSALGLLDVSLPDGFGASLHLLVERSLVLRAERVLDVPVLVGEALQNVAPGVVANAARRVAHAVAAAARRPALTENEVAALSETTAQVAVHLADASQWDLVLGLAGSNLLDLLNTRGRWKEYAVLLRLAVRAAAALDRRATQVELGCRLSRKLLQMGDADGGRAALRDVEQVVGPDGDTLEHAELYSHRALFTWSDDDGLALREFERSRSIREANGDRSGLVVVNKLIGNVHLRRGEYDAARSAYERGLAIEPIAERENHRLETETCLAFCDLNDGHPELAEHRLRDVIARMQELHYVAGQPNALFGLALALERRSDDDAALAAARQALAAATAEPHVARAAELLVWRLETSANPAPKPVGPHA